MRVMTGYVSLSSVSNKILQNGPRQGLLTRAQNGLVDEKLFADVIRAEPRAANLQTLKHDKTPISQGP